MNHKRVFVLGAGSSIGHSQACSASADFTTAPFKFPSIDDFFTKANELELRSACGLDRITHYAKIRFGWDVWKKKKVDIEDLFTDIEIELERNASPELLDVRREILSLIKRTLDGLAKPILGQGGQYSLLTSRLQPEDTIITFNWDLLLDHLLGRQDLLDLWHKERSLDHPRKQYANFLTELSGYGEQTISHAAAREPYSIWEGNTGYFLKLHGSIDWFYCANDRCRCAGKLFPIREPSKLYRCSECYEPTEELIIPPVLNKAYRQYPAIRRIWNIASQELRVCTELVIWGYSLPPTDFHASWLLRQAREAPLVKVSIVNPQVEPPKSSLVRRLVELFYGQVRKDQIFLYKTFSDYSDNKPIGTRSGKDQYQPIIL